MAAGGTLTPMLRQYKALKRDHPDAILLFRMGDFYEMFYEDAQLASSLAELTLTARGKGTDNVVPMCGFPHHQLENYSARLVRANHSVAICEQVEDPRKAKGLVKREVVRVVTPGTVTDLAELDSKANSWLAAVAEFGGRPGLALLDASTGEFVGWEAESTEPEPWRQLAERLREFTPKEIVTGEQFQWPVDFDHDTLAGAARTSADAFVFSSRAASELLTKQFGVASMDGFGFRGKTAALCAAGGLLSYAQDTQNCLLTHVDGLIAHEPARHLLLDPATRRNLELSRSLRDGQRRGSLLHAVDQTVTPGGGRLLRRWLSSPLIEAPRIEARHAAVEELLTREEQRGAIREGLGAVQDIERLLTRCVNGLANPREIKALGLSLARLGPIVAVARELDSPRIARVLAEHDECRSVVDEIERAMIEDPPIAIRDGGVFRDGFHEELDELRSIGSDGRSFLAGIEAREREATGITSLKVRFNKVFGYFIEVSKSNLSLVPEHYHRKQTIANGERYITPELKEVETKILNAKERIEQLELTLFRELRERIAAQAPAIKKAAQTAATLDVLAGFARLAEAWSYTRPTIVDEPTIFVRAGRHPVVEQTLEDQAFVPNETTLGASAAPLAILTGPNMGGKSTYLRQVALITLLAQAGSFVPAKEARIGIADRIFCRVGASDSLAEGQSTFMVEMTETANILHHATPRSLLLLDEIGRGTSTYDGLSIAWAVVEHLGGLPGGAPRTLFATHYHELTQLADSMKSVSNLRMAVREGAGKVTFLHRVESGASDRSYGIHVARLAGVPDVVVSRAESVLARLESQETSEKPHQPSLFAVESAPEPPGPIAAISEELRRLAPEALTPLEALQTIDRWRRELTDGES